MTDIVERLRSDAEDIALLKIVETDKIRQKYRIYGTVVEAADEIERLRKANKRLGEIATDAVGWLPPASVNGPREEYQNEIKELTDGHC
jgi:hypothetical protein